MMRSCNMPNRTLALLILTCIVCAFAATGAAADDVLVFAVETVTVRDGETSSTPKIQSSESKRSRVETESSKVWIEPRRVIIAYEDFEAIYDFDASKLTILSPSERTYREYPIECKFDERMQELQTQLRIAREGQTTGRSETDMLELESSLALALPKSREFEKLRFSLESGVHIAQAGGRQFFEWRDSDTPIPPALSGGFLRYLHYSCQSHPSVHSKITTNGFLPLESTSRIYFGGIDQVTTTSYIPLQVVMHPSPSRQGFVRECEVPSVPEVCAAAPTDGAEWEKARESLHTWIRRRLDEGAPLDALLGAIEEGLQFGEVDSELMVEALRKSQIDPRYEPFSVARGQLGGGDVASGIAAMEKIDRSGLEKGYMLDLFIGTGYLDANDYGNSGDRLGKVLAANPKLTGAYHDLGQAFRLAHLYKSAWACFAAGRAVNPDTELIEDIERYSQKIRADFPDYF